jgi:hypothetical protein
MPTFAAFWVSVDRGLRGSRAFANRINVTTTARSLAALQSQSVSLVLLMEGNS